MIRSRVPAALGSALLVLGAAARARADVPAASPLPWNDEWTHAGPADYVATGIGLSALAVEEITLQPTQPPLRWQGPILFDQAARGLLRGATPRVRQDATVSSWVVLGAVVGYPVVVDIPYASARYGPRVAWDLWWQDATALSLATAFDMGVRDLVGRARPGPSDCLAAGRTAADCLGSNTEATRSFPGGHFAVATTGAALTCTQHLSMHLYGSPWDAVACASAISADVALGTLRLVTDNHWASDIVAGGFIGVAFGWGMPVLMHLHAHPGAPTYPALLVVPSPVAVDHGAGLGAAGVF